MANEATGNIRLTFEISNGDQLLRREEISAESVTIGRGPAARIRLQVLRIIALVMLECRY